MEKGGKPISIPEANWKRVSRTLDFILSYPVKEVKPKEYKQPTLPIKGVVFEAKKGG